MCRCIQDFSIFFFILYACTVSAQNADAIYQVIDLDSITIQAAREEELDVKEFINWMITDESFYRAFKNLRTASYTFNNQILILEKDKLTPRATYSSQATQVFDKPCRSMSETGKSIQGDFYTHNDNYKWYTARLYDRLFFTHGRVCVDSSGEPGFKNNPIEHQVQELKKLIFSPGTSTHIPLLGDKTAIFETGLQPYYDYRFQLDSMNAEAYYLFEIEVKPEFKQKGENKTVIKKLQTWFAKDTHQIVRRDYHLAGNTIAYSFDVLMHVEVTKKEDRYFPSLIQYEGTWKIFTKKRENAKFTIAFSDFNY